MKQIQLFVPTFRTEECLEEIRECLEKGWTGLGFKTIQLEEKWKEYTGLPHAHYLNSATVGLDLAVNVLKEQNGWQDGDEIISTPMTFVSTNHAILYNKMKVVFADVDEYLCLDPKSVEERITAKTKAVMFVGLGGNTGRFFRSQKNSRIRNLFGRTEAFHRRQFFSLFQFVSGHRLQDFCFNHTGRNTIRSHALRSQFIGDNTRHRD